ncbi:TerB family tellurite resistance protein [Hydrogenophaga sp.]|uniref:TerB family tellurite resistance protein n=1 Tax=Hydrogenophaga sp. TaxID=1904254 RepID=UPI0026319339|nr:TerB family tellurite resistance protein [Hydrogenophaga sp.]MDM7951411.1 TerB family tellurite resistance protein [Hydrogenophaga sp.]
MRSYPINSPEAAARLVAMALVADGHYATAEIRALDRLSAPSRLGLAPEAFKLVMDHFCEDLLLASHGEWMGSAAIDSATRRRLFAEVQDPALGAEVRALCEAVMLCDSHLADGETELLDDMARAWPMPLNPTHRTSSMEQLAA